MTHALIQAAFAGSINEWLRTHGADDGDADEEDDDDADADDDGMIGKLIARMRSSSYMYINMYVMGDCNPAF